MRRLQLKATALGALSLSWTAYGYQTPNYRSLNSSSVDAEVDILRAQLSLLGARDECPPWYQAPVSQDPLQIY
jgi:hypothetical protein